MISAVLLAQNPSLKCSALLNLKRKVNELVSTAAWKQEKEGCIVADKKWTRNEAVFGVARIFFLARWNCESQPKKIYWI